MRLSSCLFLIVAAIAQPALGSLTLSLDIGNAGPSGLASSGYPGPFGFVTIDYVDATHALIELTNTGTSPTPPTVYFYGAQGTLGLNVNGAVNTAATIATILATHPFNTGAISSGGPGNEDGFGSFNFTLDTAGSYTNSSSKISFTLVGSGTSWTSDNDVLVPNASGYLAAAHVLVSADGTKDGGAALTGYAANGGTIPEPTAVTVWSMLIAATCVASWGRGIRAGA